MRKVWATTEAMPHSDAVIGQAHAAGASEIITIPSAQLPSLLPGYNEVAEHVPAAPVPTKTISPRQGRLALYQTGRLDTVDSIVASQGKDVQIWYEFATTWERTNPVLNSMATALGMSSQDVDDLFTLAASL